MLSLYYLCKLFYLILQRINVVFKSAVLLVLNQYTVMTKHVLLRFQNNSTKVALLVIFLVGLKLLSMYSPTLDYGQMTRNLTEKEFLDIDFDPSQNLDIDEDAIIDDEVTEEMEEVLNQLRYQIREEMKGYKLPSFRNVEELFPEKKGTPMRSLVITTWRSGSTFIGGVLNSHPATFHYSEPLTDFKTVQVRDEPLASPAIRALRSLLTCNYRVLERYLERSRHYTWLFTHNTRLWYHCGKHKDICWLPQFLSPVCRLFPFQSMKVVHIRLRLVQQLLDDPKLNVRVVYLVRDPRGIMESRSTMGWCKKHEDCSDPVHVCADSVDDYSAALRFTKLFPDRFKVVRYEDMSLRPDEVLRDMFKFFGLQYHSNVQDFVKIHTTLSNNNRYSTYRNSSATALLWRRTSDYGEVQELQHICRVALSAWGYLPAHNASHLLEFNPLDENIHLP